MSTMISMKKHSKGLRLHIKSNTAQTLIIRALRDREGVNENNSLRYYFDRRSMHKSLFVRPNTPNLEFFINDKISKGVSYELDDIFSNKEIRAYTVAVEELFNKWSQI